MSFRGFTLLEIMSISTPWVTPEHPERLSLQALLSTVGMIRFIEAVHGDVLGVLTDEERARLGLLRDSASLKNLRHDDVARIIYFCLRAHEILLGDTPEGRAVTDVRSVMFPDDLYIVRASYRERHRSVPVQDEGSPRMVLRRAQQQSRGAANSGHERRAPREALPNGTLPRHCTPRVDAPHHATAGRQPLEHSALPVCPRCRVTAVRVTPANKHN